MKQHLSQIIRRTMVILGLTFKEALRRRILIFMALCCVLFVASGSGCIGACRAIQKNSLERTGSMQRERIKKSKLTAAEKQIALNKLDEAISESKQKEKKSLKSVLFLLTFSMISFWLFAIALIFTPFLAMNDFQNRNYVLILSRPVERWEYLMGKFVAILSLLLLYLIILLAVSFLSMHIFMEAPDWRFFKGIIILLEGLLVFTAMLVFLTLLIGRVPALFTSIAIIGLGFIPAIYLISDNLNQIESQSNTIIIYILGYGLPQYALNFFYAASKVLTGNDMAMKLFKVGNETGFHSLFINAGWFIFFCVSSLIIFKNKELES